MTTPARPALKISVITVAFNSATTIGETLASVAQQTWSDLEHIVVDGASSDGTAQVVRRQGARVAQLISEPDDGIYDAMNKGLRAASGDVIAFLNADDRYAHANVLANIARLMDDASVDAVFGDVAFFRPAEPLRLVRRYDSTRFTPARIGWGWMPAHPATFVRKRLFDEFGGFRLDFRIAGDYEWIARACSRCDLRYQHLPEVLVHMQTGGISTRGWRSTLLLNQEVMRACRDNGIPTNWFKILSKYPAKLLGYVRS